VPDGKCIIIEPGHHMTVARFKKGVVHGHYMKMDQLGQLEEGNNDPDFINPDLSISQDSDINEDKIFKGMHKKLKDMP